MRGSFHGNSVKITAILHLTLINILISTGKTIMTTLRFCDVKMETSRTAQVVWGVWAACYHLWYFTFYLMLIYRFLCCNYPSEYHDLAAPSECNLSITWGVGAIIGLCFCVFDTLKVREVYNGCLWLTFDGIFLVLFFVTYATVFCRMKQTHSTSAEERKLFRLTAALFIAALIFEVAPTIGNASMSFVNLEMRFIFRHTIDLLWAANILMHPVICIIYKVTDRRNRVTIMVSMTDKQKTSFPIT